MNALQEYRILETPPEEHFDVFAELLRCVFDAPAAYLGFIDGRRLWFKSSPGLAEGSVELAERPHGETVRARTDMVVELADVAGPFPYYCGTPVVSVTGTTLGAIAVLDGHPRTATPAQRSSLVGVARAVTFALEARRRVWSSLNVAQHETYVFDSRSWSLIYADPSALSELETPAMAGDLNLDEVFRDIDGPSRDALEALSRGSSHEPVTFTARLSLRYGGRRRMACVARRLEADEEEHFIVIGCERADRRRDRAPLYALSFSARLGTIGEQFGADDQPATLEGVMAKINRRRRPLGFAPAGDMPTREPLL